MDQLNNNMRCFEMCDDADVYVVDVPLNNNMRCFEINKFLRFWRQLRKVKQ